ncbi:MAG: hypothetical protein HYU53_05400 [Acidobacteria bacterium]|nr:hypothetical protein [Acidobacteriota bacterium]
MGDDEAQLQDLEITEGGRGVRLDESPEGRLLHEETLAPGRASVRLPDTTRERFQDIDDRAADAARMDVRRREHSAE